MKRAIWCTNFDLQIGSIRQVTVLQYKKNYFEVQISIFKKAAYNKQRITIQNGLFGVQF